MSRFFPARLPGILLLVTMAACEGSTPDPQVNQVFIRDVANAFVAPDLAQFCCDPDGPFPQLVGTVNLRFGTRILDYEFKFRSPDGILVADPSEGRVDDGSAGLVVRIFATRCDWDTAEMTLKTFLPGKEDVERESQEQRLTATNICGPSSNVGLGVIGDMAEAVVAGGRAALNDKIAEGPTGVATKHSAPEVPDKIPSDPGTDILQSSFAPVDLTREDFESNFGEAAVDAFAASLGVEVVASEMTKTTFRDEFALAGFETIDDIPLDGTRVLQYGLVFESDSFPDNNFVPEPRFANDFFKDTDLWFEVTFVPTIGWSLRAFQIRNNIPTEVRTDARVLIKGNGMLFVLPREEITAFFPSYRVTSFSHTGDFGLNPPFDWSGDTQPPVGQFLIPTDPALLGD